MNIPDEAVEAAYAHRQEENGTPFLRFHEQQYILGILKAAGPAIAAQAWDEGALAGHVEVASDEAVENPYRRAAA